MPSGNRGQGYSPLGAAVVYRVKGAEIRIEAQKPKTVGSKD